MSMVKYGAQPDQTSKTASGNPGTYVAAPTTTKSLKQQIEDKKSKK